MRLGKIELSFSISVIRPAAVMVDGLLAAGGELRESRTGPTTHALGFQKISVV